MLLVIYELNFSLLDGSNELWMQLSSTRIGQILSALCASLGELRLQDSIKVNEVPKRIPLEPNNSIKIPFQLAVKENLN